LIHVALVLEDRPQVGVLEGPPEKGHKETPRDTVGMHTGREHGTESSDGVNHAWNSGEFRRQGSSKDGLQGEVVEQVGLDTSKMTGQSDGCPEIAEWIQPLTIHLNGKPVKPFRFQLWTVGTIWADGPHFRPEFDLKTLCQRQSKIKQVPFRVGEQHNAG
jgi:hypothetical protein